MNKKQKIFMILGAVIVLVFMIGCLILLWIDKGRLSLYEMLLCFPVGISAYSLSVFVLLVLGIPFNRISIGAQSMNDSELKRLGRLHNSDMFKETFFNARKAGFENINVDVMSALPGQSLKSYLDSLEKIADLSPEHISAYSLIVEEGTPFYDMDLDLPMEDEEREMYHRTKEYLKRRGYHRYEISNYALGDTDRYECYHNKVYWKRGNYLGVGLGAASMVENVRWSNTRDINRYTAIVSASDRSSFEKIRENTDVLSIKAQMEEYMFLGLRLIGGISYNKFRFLFGRSMPEIYGGVIDKYIRMGLLEPEDKGDDTFLRLTDTGLDVSNTVMADFLF